MFLIALFIGSLLYFLRCRHYRPRLVYHDFYFLYTCQYFSNISPQKKHLNICLGAFELGHSVHSYYTINNQSFVYGYCTIFLAEVVSTIYEKLLTRILYQKYIRLSTKIFKLLKYLFNLWNLPSPISKVGLILQHIP
ncbi:MAG: M3 family metallopeptidase [Defluviitaleaceae bacterium]|nr:M3 family metallopeptidase [Defluviitaleaceae bacterium]